MHLEFYGAAGEVTGSCHLLRVRGRLVLLDCGMVQGDRDAESRNRQDLPFAIADVAAVVLSHAHLDHSGRLPLLVRRGYRGPIYATRPTAELTAILLRDAAALAEARADYSSDPLFGSADVERTLALLRPLPYDAERELLAGIAVRLRDAGHIMGSASVEVRAQESGEARTLVFSGDLGQYDSPILLDPHRFESADVVVMESTYGDRRHRDRAATLRELGEILKSAAASGGNLVIPAFAVGRSQELLYELGRHYEPWELGRWSIWLDSPMAIEASEVYWRHADRHDEAARALHRRSGAMPPLPNLQLARTAGESRAIDRVRAGAIIIAGSGMCNGGRVLRHLRRNLGRPECHVVIVAFQAPGTLGRRLVDGARSVRIEGEEIRVAATIHTLGGFSAHGGQDDLLRWYDAFAARPPAYLVHGEARAAQALGSRLAALGTRATVAYPGLKVDLLAP